MLTEILTESNSTTMKLHLSERMRKENCDSEKTCQSVSDEHATVPRDPAPLTLSHEHSDVDTMESDSCQSSADAGDSQETGSVGDETVAKGGDDDDGDDDAEILVATKSSGKRRMVMASDSEQEEEDRPVVDDGEDGDSTRASGEGEVGDNSHASGDREDGGTHASDDSDAEPVMSDRLRQLLAKGAAKKQSKATRMIDSDDEQQVGPASGSHKEGGVASGSEDGEEPVMSDKLRQLLAKGAAKKDKGDQENRRRKSQKSVKEDLMNLHSETQRLVRESGVKLPYHVPAKLDLSVILERTRQKHLQLEANGMNLSWKSNTTINVSPALTPSRLATDSSKVATVDLPEANTPLPASAANDADTVVNTPATVHDGTGGSVPNMYDLDDLPDLIVESDKNKAADDDDDILPASTSELMQQTMPNQEGENNSDSACPDVRASPEKQTTEPQPSVELTEQPKTDNQCLVDTPKTADKDNKTSSSSRLMERIKTSGDAKLLSLTPRLGVHHGDMVSLDDDEDAERASEAESGTTLLLQRLMKHIRVEKTPKAKDVEIRTVVKEGSEDTATLKTDVFVYSCDPVIDADSVSKLSKPGEKLALLKEKLSEKMKVRRQESLQKRYELYTQEFGDQDDKRASESEKEEEEEEMTDEEDSEEEEEVAEVEDLEESYQKEKPRERSAFVNDEAEEDEDEEDGDYNADDQHSGDEADVDGADDDGSDDDASDEAEDDDDVSEGENADGAEVQVSGQKTRKRIQLLDDDDSDEEQAGKDVGSSSLTESVVEGHEESFNAANTSTDLIGSLLPLGQPISTKSRPLPPSRAQSQEDMVPDLFLQDDEDNEAYIRVQSTPLAQKFANPDGMASTQLFDENGLLKTQPSTRKGPTPQALFSSSTDNAEELLDLCSAPFANNDRPKAARSLLEQGLTDTQAADVDELLGLCSGRFIGDDASQVPQKSHVMTQESLQDTQLDLPNQATQDYVSDDDDGRDSPVLRKRSIKKKRRLQVNDSDDDDNHEQVNEDVASDQAADDGDNVDSLDDEASDAEQRDREEEEQARAVKFKGFTYGHQHGKIRKEFVENEAEMSGSDHGSDAEDDLNDDADLLEDDADADINMTEEQLRDQLGRLHNKVMIDEDKRQLRLYQEMYLPDGDLHSDGSGRLRRFRWSNIDGDSQQDMFTGVPGDDDLPEETEEESQWRMERYEREKFLQEKQSKDGVVDNSSLLLKLGQVVFRQSAGPHTPSPAPASVDDKTASAFKVPSGSYGSILQRSRDSLEKIVEKAKPVKQQVAPAQSGKSFVFATLSPENEKNKTAKTVKRSNTSDLPTAKKSKVERSNSLPVGSIFHFL